jgi:Right handed beta helix region
MPKKFGWYVCVATVLFLVASNAEAKTVNVTCGSATINNALKTLDPSESNLIRVSGICHEFVTITDFAQLSIIGMNSGSGITGSNAGSLLWIVGSHVRIRNLTLNGGKWGVMCRDFSVCFFNGNTVENAFGRGVELNNADATFNGDVIQANTNVGLTMTASRARATNVIVKNTVAGAAPVDGIWPLPGDGIDLQNGSSLTIEGLVVNGNAGTGIEMFDFSSIHTYGQLSVTNNLSGGIWVTGNSSAIIGGAVVTGNQSNPTGNGTGLVVTGNSSVGFWNGGTVTGNDPSDMYCSVNSFVAGLTGVNVDNNNGCVDPYQ